MLGLTCIRINGWGWGCFLIALVHGACLQLATRVVECTLAALGCIMTSKGCLQMVSVCQECIQMALQGPEGSLSSEASKGCIWTGLEPAEVTLMGMGGRTGGMLMATRAVEVTSADVEAGGCIRRVSLDAGEAEVEILDPGSRMVGGKAGVTGFQS
jgi:hypothetical protein